MPYIWRPGDVFRRYLKAIEMDYDEKSFQLGAMYVTLEIMSQIKLMEERYVVSEYGRNEAISALHTLLHQLHLADDTYELYDRLIRWRQPRFVAEHAREPEDTVAAADDETRAWAPSFPGEEPVPWPSRLGSSDASPQAHQSPEPSEWPTREGWESAYGTA